MPSTALANPKPNHRYHQFETHLVPRPRPEMASFAVAVLRKLFKKKPAFTEPTRIKLSTLLEERRMAVNQGRIRCNGSVVPLNVPASEEEKKQLCASDRR
ncbi:hypothetical protein Aduo_009633 [Ancylostoma duodenale]